MKRCGLRKSRQGASVFSSGYPRQDDDLSVSSAWKLKQLPYHHGALLFLGSDLKSPFPARPDSLKSSLIPGMFQEAWIIPASFS